jgi:hypothetical protein
MRETATCASRIGRRAKVPRHRVRPVLVQCCEIPPELPFLQGWVDAMTSLRVDCEGGIGWVATRYDLNLRVIEQVRGSDEEVHRAAARWAQG